MRWLFLYIVIGLGVTLYADYKLHKKDDKLEPLQIIAMILLWLPLIILSRFNLTKED